ncbi:MAG TPA: hypothetical protein VNN79_24255 [Actinomycetota bacterium]|nr:hypothetical protein [Actinomycetota bacterium]
MTRPNRLLALPLVAVLAVGAVLAGPHGSAAPATRNAPAAAAAWGAGSLDQAVLPAHSLRDTVRSDRTAGTLPVAPPALLPRWRAAAAFVRPALPLAQAAAFDLVPRAPPSFV